MEILLLEISDLLHSSLANILENHVRVLMMTIDDDKQLIAIDDAHHSG